MGETVTLFGLMALGCPVIWKHAVHMVTEICVSAPETKLPSRRKLTSEC